jgi:hypothetical protein
MRRVIGIDPGLAGGVGVLDLLPDGRRETMLYRTPVIEYKKAGRKRREYDLSKMRALLVELMPDYPTRVLVHVGIEAQNPHPEEGVISAYRLGLGVGFWEGLAAGLELPYERVYPIVWKKHHGLLRQPKAMSQVFVGRLFPRFAAMRKADEGACEALLIATYVAAHCGWLGVTPKYNGPAPEQSAQSEKEQQGVFQL